ncbi:glycosyltransferase family 2 protein [Flavobacterium sp. KACC 22761]|uniref:glycosyltransferase family 2 protein n=1 Tax=Flavobacterium sp. KACC 22761 TaxID=3092665 RepID=UPI002A74BF1A|nr:glycosyltransferase family 2 protein [Flavobacterium sp. KACC 22761]WPO79523.1 glycosyltransferase family 2 protein [Flavobacterium sp. KACC 22761]
MSEEKSKVSVVLCTYNGSAYLKKQLDSILEQTYPIEEIIVVDDYSMDSTREILNEYKEKHDVVKLFFSEKNLGSNNSFKYAMSLATCEYIALCDQDDIWYKNKIEIQMAAINPKKDKPMVVFHDLCLIDEKDNVTHPSFWKVHGFFAERFNFKKLLIFNIVTGCTCLINKRMRDELIKCDMKDIIMHDYLIALIAYGFGNAIYINEPLMYYRSHSSSVTIKEKITFIDRVKSFFERIKNGNYLMPNILQIQKYNEVYQNNLYGQEKALVNKFIGLKNKNTINRMIYKWISN